MPGNPPSDFRRNLRREIAGYFIVVLCALPVRFWIMASLMDQEGRWAFLASRVFGYLSVGLIAAVAVSKLRLRTKLILTFLLVAL